MHLFFCLKRPAIDSDLPLGELLFLKVSRFFFSLSLKSWCFYFCFLRQIITIVPFDFLALLVVSRKGRNPISVLLKQMNIFQEMKIDKELFSILFSKCPLGPKHSILEFKKRMPRQVMILG